MPPSFLLAECLVGDAAKDHAAICPASTIHSVKRLLGRGLEDASVQAAARHLSYSLLKDSSVGASPVLQARQPKGVKELSPEEATAVVLLKLKAAAEAFLGTGVENAVVAVPSTFDSSQRAATRQACAIAGLHLLRLIDEPNAAAFSYALQTKEPTRRGERTVLLYDLGAGHLSVALHTIYDPEGMVEAVAAAGNSHLGGEDFDTCLVEWCTEEFQRKSALDMSGNARARRRLRAACESAKRALSSADKTTVDLEALHEGEDFRAVVTRVHFEELAAGCFSRVLAPVEKVLKDAKMAKEEVQEVVLVGGSSRIPKVQQLLREFFGGKEPCRAVNADEAVATGAAALAAILSRHPEERCCDTGSRLDSMFLMGFAPSSLSVETAGGITTPILRRRTCLPSKGSQTFTTVSDNQCGVHIKVFEGEYSLVKDNKLLGELYLPVPPLPRGEPQIDVTFDLDCDGLLSVEAIEKSTDQRRKIFTGDGVQRLSSAEARLMVMAAQTAMSPRAAHPAEAAGGGGGGGSGSGSGSGIGGSMGGGGGGGASPRTGGEGVSPGGPGGGGGGGGAGGWGGPLPQGRGGGGAAAGVKNFLFPPTPSPRRRW